MRGVKGQLFQGPYGVDFSPSLESMAFSVWRHYLEQDLYPFSGAKRQATDAPRQLGCVKNDGLR